MDLMATFFKFSFASHFCGLTEFLVGHMGIPERKRHYGGECITVIRWIFIMRQYHFDVAVPYSKKQIFVQDRTVNIGTNRPPSSWLPVDPISERNRTKRCCVHIGKNLLRGASWQRTQKRACRIASSIMYVHCKGCQEPYLKADFHCSHSHENFTKDQEDSFKAHTKRIANEIPNESRYPKLSVEFKVLKAVLFDIEAAIPEEAVRSEGRGNSRKIWLEKLKASLSIQVFVDARLPNRQEINDHDVTVIDHLIEFDGNVHYKPPTKSKMGSPRQHRPGPNDGKLGSTSSCVRKKRMKKSLGKVSLERPKPGECAFCRRDIGGGVGVRCTVCLGLELCLECFSQGISYPPHQKSHPYELCCGRDNKRRSREGLIHETSGRKRRRISSGCGESSSSSSSSSCRGNDIGQRSRMPKKQQQQQQQCLLLPMNGAGYSPVMMYLWENIDPEIIAEFSKISGSAINSKAPYSSHEEEGTVDLNCTQSSLPREERKRDFVRKLESRAAIGEDKGCCKLSASSTEGGGNNIEKTRQAKDKDDADSSKAFHSSAGAAPRQQQQQQQQSRSEEERPCDGTISKLKAVFKLAMCYFLGFGRDCTRAYSSILFNHSFFHHPHRAV
eukprot:jgi/Bigna1/72346/fgenesh1_pg.19_\